jgi:hypothetical protein
MNIKEIRDMTSETKSLIVVKIAGFILLCLTPYLFWWSPVGPRSAQHEIAKITKGHKIINICDICGSTQNLSPMTYSSSRGQRTLYFCPKHLTSAPTWITDGHFSSAGEGVNFFGSLIVVAFLIAGAIVIVVVPISMILRKATSPMTLGESLTMVFYGNFIIYGFGLMLPWIGVEIYKMLK